MAWLVARAVRAATPLARQPTRPRHWRTLSSPASAATETAAQRGSKADGASYATESGVGAPALYSLGVMSLLVPAGAFVAVVAGSLVFVPRRRRVDEQ